jgi:hypothetical protein
VVHCSVQVAMVTWLNITTSPLTLPPNVVVTMSATNPRIYGRRSGTKRKQAGQLPEPSPGDSVHKRRKVSVEPFVRIPSPVRTEEDVGRDLKRSPLRTPKVTVTYGSPGKRNSSPLAPLTPSPGKPTKSARDFSTIFDSIVPSSTPPPSPSKLAKRMLARSKTESSIGSQASTHDNSLERTPSLPNLLSSPSSRSDTHTQISTTIIPSLAPNFKSNTTKTYAGSFRSFLVPLPVANSSNLDLQGMESRDDEFHSRESYSSLRSRWGVDNSEDDPYPNAPVASTSNSVSPNVSPSSKGRLKPSVEASIGTMNPLKSISELRNKGETRRFLDEIGYLFEGMDKSGGIGLRRARYTLFPRQPYRLNLYSVLFKSLLNFARQNLYAKLKPWIFSAELGMRSWMQERERGRML